MDHSCIYENNVFKWRKKIHKTKKKQRHRKKNTQCKHENSISSFDMNQNHTRTETNIEKCAHNVWYESNMEFGIASKSNKSSRDDVWICGRTRDRKK